jgi:hypothetical protein
MLVGAQSIGKREGWALICFDRALALRARDSELGGIGHPLVDALLEEARDNAFLGSVTQLGGGRNVVARYLVHYEDVRGKAQARVMTFQKTPNDAPKLVPSIDWLANDNSLQFEHTEYRTDDLNNAFTDAVAARSHATGARACDPHWCAHNVIRSYSNRESPSRGNWREVTMAADSQVERPMTAAKKNRWGHDPATKSAFRAAASLVWFLLVFPEPKQSGVHELVSRNFPSWPIPWPFIAR